MDQAQEIRQDYVKVNDGRDQDGLQNTLLFESAARALYFKLTTTAQK